MYKEFNTINTRCRKNSILSIQDVQRIQYYRYKMYKEFMEFQTSWPPRSPDLCRGNYILPKEFRLNSSCCFAILFLRHFWLFQSGAISRARCHFWRCFTRQEREQFFKDFRRCTDQDYPEVFRLAQSGRTSS